MSEWVGPFAEPLRQLKIDGTDFAVLLERDNLGLTVKQGDKTLFYLNLIGTTVLKKWLNDFFDTENRFLSHQSVQKILGE